MEKEYNKIPVKSVPHEEMIRKLKDQIFKNERKYQMTSDEMLALVSKGDDRLESLEVLQWMQAFRAYQSCLEGETDTVGIVGTTIEASTKDD